MNFLKKYWIVIVGAIVVGMFTVMPWLLFLNRVGDDFQGVWPQYNGDAFFYLARAHEVFDGHPDMNHQYFWEHKNDVYPQAIGAESFLAFISKILNIDLPTLQVAMDFISPAILYILTFILLMTVFRQKYLATFIPLILYIVLGGVNKPVHPQLSLPLLLIFLIFWIRLIKLDKQKIQNAILAGVMFGLLFLTYHYHWMLLIVLTGIFILILLLNKKWLELKYHSLMLIIAVIIGIPYFIQLFVGTQVSYYAEMMTRMGMYYSHMPETWPRLIVALVWLGFFIFFARYYKIENKPTTQAITSLLIANVMFPNHQVITGIIVQNANHWPWMPILIFAITTHYIINYILKHKAEIKGWKINRVILIITLILFIVPVWRLSTFAFKPFLQNYKVNDIENLVQYGVIPTENLQYYRSILDWMNENITSDSVILSDNVLMNFIPVYTHANVYYIDYAQWLPNSDQEIAERIILSRFFDKEYFTEEGYGVKNHERILWIQPAQTEYNTHVILDSFGLDWKLDYEPQYSLVKEHEKIKKIYQNLQTEGWNINLLKKYKLDYIVWDKNREPEWNLHKYPELMRIYDIDGIEIYTFKTPNN